MVSRLNNDITAPFIGRIRNRAVLEAMRRVGRESFLDASMLPKAGEDMALPIGFSQTTSSPFVIARMLEMMLNGAPSLPCVLEIGSGCGYQTAVLAELGGKVFGVERIGALARLASARLRKLKYNNIRIKHADGWNGWKENAPYDGIVVCAETSRIPMALLAQLQPGRRLVLPLRKNESVRLVAVNANGEIVARREDVAFVPMLAGMAG